MDVIHTAIWVSDLETARAFFVDALGLEEHWSFTMDGVENVYVGGEHDEIQLRYDPERADPTPGHDALDHVAIAVDDVATETERMVAATNCDVLEGPMRVEAADTKVSFIEGPDGYVVELVENSG